MAVVGRKGVWRAGVAGGLVAIGLAAVAWGGGERPGVTIEPVRATSQERPATKEPATAAPAEAPEARQARIAALRVAYSRPPGEWPAPTVDPSVKWVELGLLPRAPHPEGNPAFPAKVELGRLLFFDPRASGSGQIACASCHDPDLAWADGRTVSFGHGRTPLARNAPSVFNIAYQPVLFWDGRAADLEAQATMVIENPDEMHSGEEVIDRLEEIPAYREAFTAAFGSDDITLQRASMALAAYQRTLVGGRSDFDAFLKGATHALSDSAIAGLDLFRNRAGCLNCHHGPNFADGQFHDLGLSYYGRKYEDLGRYEITKSPADVGRFRTPSLRNIAATAPYMHNGLFDLEGVLRMYNAGMATLRRKPEQANDPLFPTKDPLLKPLQLSETDLEDLMAFLRSLSEPRLRVRPPALPEGPPDNNGPSPQPLSPTTP